MRITIINGSPRKSGSTAKILKKMQENFEKKEEVTVSYYDLTDYSLLECSGCLSCYARGVCHLKDNLGKILFVHSIEPEEAKKMMMLVEQINWEI